MNTQISHTQSLIFTRDIKLASCLSAMGIPVRNPNPVETVIDDRQGPVCWFYFLKAPLVEDYIKAWESPVDTYGTPDHPLYSPQHPYWYIRAALMNHQRFLQGVKEGRQVYVINKNGKTYVKVK